MVSKYERGHVQPQFSVAAKFQILFGARIEDIFPEEFKRFQREVDLVKENKRRGGAVHFEEHI